MSYNNQQQPPFGVPPPQDGYPKDAYPPPGYPPQSYPPQQGYPPPPQYPPQYVAPPPPQQQAPSGGILEFCLGFMCCCCMWEACCD
ncbi:hypothetical protein MLD38_022906 [Melastoma candidum]|uniref:Uncharacterized protein n=1 Tax=Melastoma candidum TaxID=119954 RepID=A0ACB9QKT3_9MYRT|nr:hypothetical protein MLD38_022906 [Melastoma candidum]